MVKVAEYDTEPNSESPITHNKLVFKVSFSPIKVVPKHGAVSRIAWNVHILRCISSRDLVSLVRREVSCALCAAQRPKAGWPGRGTVTYRSPANSALTNIEIRRLK